MTRSFIKIVVFSLALNLLGAADLLRPSVQLSSSEHGVQVNLDFQQVTAEQWREMLDDPQGFHNHGYGVYGEPGEPALPMFTILVPVTEMGDHVVSEVIRVDQPLNGLVLKAAPPGHLDSDLDPVQVEPYDWNRTNRSMAIEAELGDAVQIKGVTYLPLSVHPIRLNETTRTPYIPTTLELHIQGAELGDPTLISMDGGLRSVSLPEDQFVSRGHYLIISPPQFLDYMQYFVNWKRRMGYEVTVTSTAVTGNSASTIQNYIQDAWDTWESRPDHLVIVGDEDQGIPGHYIQNPQGDNLVTDHPYGLLEGDDSFPELMVGRLSVDTISELVAFTAKIVRYESEPYMDDPAWFQRALMISTTWGAASTQATKEWVADKLIEHGYDQVYTAYHPQVSNTSAIANPINSGVGFVNYRGFGMYNGWFGPDFMNSNIYSLINTGAKNPVITSVVCGGGNFAASENDPCFGEVWTRVGTFSVPNGAVAFFGPSELYTHTQFNNVIDIGIYSGIFDQGMSTLGEALWNGKFELWRNYHSNSYFPFNQTPEFYHHVYNLLGDPGMQLWTAVPEVLEVAHLSTLSSGDNHLEISVTDESGTPVPSAYVALTHPLNAWGGYTNASGNIVLPFAAMEQTEVQLTITGKNLYPYQSTLPIINEPHPLELVEWSFAEGMQPIAGESGAMVMTLNNPGEVLSEVEVRLTSAYADLHLDTTFTIPSFAAQSNYLDTLLLDIPTTHHGTPFTIEMMVQSDETNWSWQQFFTIQAPHLEIAEVAVISGNLSVGGSAELELMIENTGGAASHPMTITPMGIDFVSYAPGALNCPAIELDASLVVSGPIQIVFDELLFPGEQLTLYFECAQPERVDTLEVQVVLDGANRFGPSPRDAYGYRMFDQFDLNYSKAPVFDWEELSTSLGGNGTPVGIHDIWEEDDESVVLQLPFTVNYYGQNYDQITVCSNGWAAFGSHSVVNFHNRRIPSPIGPPAMIAPFWDDLITSPGAVYTKHDAENDLFIIEWSRLQSLFYSNQISFQVVLYGNTLHPTEGGENDIKFQYLNFQNVDISSNFATIGIEAPNSEIGIEASYNNDFDPSIEIIEAGSALLFTTDRGEHLGASEINFSATDLSFQLVPWTSAQDSIMISNTGASPLIYEISVVPDVLTQPVVPIPVDPSITKMMPDPLSEEVLFREGSDEYGYTWRDNHDEDGPAYQWVDIETENNRLPYTSEEYDDCTVGPLELGFDFPLYDDAYSTVYMGSNGTLTFEGLHSPWYNIALPSAAAPSAILAPWWDDLNGDLGPQGTFYFWTNGVDECIFTWRDFPKFGTSSFYSFQVILDAYGNITYQYADVGEIVASSTIGIQNSGRNLGLTVRHNSTAPMEAGTAIAIQPPTLWFSASGWANVLQPGESAQFIIDINARDSEAGVYETTLAVSSTAPNAPQTFINIALEVYLGETPFGDVNGDYLVNIHDVTKLFDYILHVEEMDDIQFILADLSADDQVDVKDLVLLIESMIMSHEP